MTSFGLGIWPHMTLAFYLNEHLITRARKLKYWGCKIFKSLTAVHLGQPRLTPLLEISAARGSWRDFFLQLETCFYQIEYFVNPWKLSARVSNNNTLVWAINPNTWTLKSGSPWFRSWTRFSESQRLILRFFSWIFQKILEKKTKKAPRFRKNCSISEISRTSFLKLLMKPKKHPCGNYNQKLPD